MRGNRQFLSEIERLTQQQLTSRRIAKIWVQHLRRWLFTEKWLLAAVQQCAAEHFLSRNERFAGDRYKYMPPPCIKSLILQFINSDQPYKSGGRGFEIFVENQIFKPVQKVDCIKTRASRLTK